MYSVMRIALFKPDLLHVMSIQHSECFNSLVHVNVVYNNSIDVCYNTSIELTQCYLFIYMCSFFFYA